MNEEQRINSYFGRVKQNPPLFNADKVNQIIAEAKTKVEVEKGHRNLLRFIVMTTLFAIIISAFLFWPKAPEEIPSTKEQIPNEIVPASSTAPAEKSNMPDIRKESGEMKLNSGSTAETISVEKKNQVKNDPFQFKTISYGVFYPWKTDKNHFGLILSQKQTFNLPVDKDSTIHLTLHSKGEKKLISGTYQFSAQSNEEFESMTFNGQYYKNAETVFNIIGGKIECDTSRATFSLAYEFILEGGQKVIGKYSPQPVENKERQTNTEQAKQKIVYSEQILDSTFFIQLDRAELESLGFRLNGQSVEFSDFYKGGKFFMSYTDSSMAFGVKMEPGTLMGVKNDSIKPKTKFVADQINISLNRKQLSPDNEGIIPMLVTNEKGKSFVKMMLPEEELKTYFSERYSKDFRTLLPVVMKRNTFGDQPLENIVYWFLPTDEFFNRLPQEISKELLEEYEYVTAEDKSSLVKPVCKYFDECRNTLDVSNFKVFPNPANSKATVTFKLNQAIDGKISLVDLAGRERQVLQPQTSLSAGSHRFDVDVSNVPEGIYLITLYSDQGVQTQRFIVTH